MSAFPDPQKFKQAMASQWNEAASGWNENATVIRPWLQASTEAMLNMANTGPGMDVLDVAAGAGDQTLDIATRVGSSGSVVATDLSSDILKFAKNNATRAGFSNVETIVADGENLPISDATFDGAVSRLGLMFFLDPSQGLREIYRVLKPGARFCSIVFSTIESNPCLAILMSTALKHAGEPPMDPYRAGSLLSLGKPGQLETMFTEAGFKNSLTTRVSAPFHLPSARHYLDFVRSSAAPVLQILTHLDTPDRDKAWQDMETKLEAFNTDAGWAGPNELLLTTGVK